VDYAQARIQARYGERPDESAWHTLTNARESGTLIEAVRSCGLRRWITGLDASSGSHAIEISLRARWRESVDELASWMPAPWRDATLWVSGLPDLPGLCRLARGEPPLPWMSQDPILHAYTVPDAEERRRRLLGGALAFADLAPLPPSPAEDGSDAIEPRVRHAWDDQWRKRWPARRSGRPLDQVAELVQSGAREPLLLGRNALARHLRLLFRNLTLHPAVAFVYLALTAIDMTRLRAELLKHALLREAGLAS
jgi:hypothetical protein